MSANDPIADIRMFANVPPMKNIKIVVLLLLLAGCGEQIDENYPTYAEAQRAGAVKRGWVPAFVPSSASDIEGSHDLDTSRQTLQFKIPPSAVKDMVAGLSTVSSYDQKALAELFDKHGLRRASEGYVICSDVRNGALVVDPEIGRAVYDTTINWVDDDCS